MVAYLQIEAEIYYINKKGVKQSMIAEAGNAIGTKLYPHDPSRSTRESRDECRENKDTIEIDRHSACQYSDG